MLYFFQFFKNISIITDVKLQSLSLKQIIIFIS